MDCTSVLDKTQASFKQITTSGAVRGDPILLLSKERVQPNTQLSDIWAVMNSLIRQATESGDPVELTPQRLYSRLVAYYVGRHQDVPLDAESFYRQFVERAKASEQNNG